MQDFVLPRLV